MRAVDRFAQRSTNLYNGQDILKNHFLDCYPILYTSDPENYDQIKPYADQHEFVWVVDSGIETLRSFPWHFRPKEKNAEHLFPYVYKKSRRVKNWRLVKLVPTNYIGNKTITHTHVCGVYDAYKGYDQFDMFFIGKANETYEKLSTKFNNIQIVKSHKEAKAASKTDMFWLIPDDIIVSDTFNFTFTPDEWSFDNTHVFGNGDSRTHDGIALFPKSYQPTAQELTHRFYANKKERNIIASDPRPYDIVFIGKDGKHADENFKTLTARFPNAHRINNTVGIHQAYIAAAKLCSTDMFWVVDGDAEIANNFCFNHYIPWHDSDSKKTVHEWKAVNPINTLTYGYGAVKLLPTHLTINMDTTKPDVVDSIGPLFKIINQVSNVTKFNTDEFSTWSSAFRECAILSTKTIKGRLTTEAEFRLNIWCNVGKDKPFGDYCIAGAKSGKLYGETNAADPEKLSMINDFVWLEQQFKKSI